MLLCDSRLTLVRRSGTGYSCTPLENASVYSVISDEAGESSYSVRLPECTVIPEPGDYIIIGEVKSIASVTALGNYTHFRVTAISDCRRGRLPHIRVTGK